MFSDISDDELLSASELVQNFCYVEQNDLWTGDLSNEQLLIASQVSDTVSRLCKAAGFVGFFSNHSLRATCATRLFDADVDEQLIKLKTGHASDAVRSYKRVAENKLESLTDVVACKCRKDDESLSPAASYCNEPAAVVNVDRPTGVDNASVPSINFGNISGDGIVIHLNINNSA